MEITTPPVNEPTPDPSGLFDLTIDGTARTYLKNTTRWTRFLAITGFVFCGLLIPCLFIVGPLLSSLYTFSAVRGDSFVQPMDTRGLLVGIIIQILLLLFPSLFLFRFSTSLKIALQSNDQQRLNLAFKNMRIFYRFLGILLLIFLSLGVLMLLFSVIMALLFGARG